MQGGLKLSPFNKGLSNQDGLQGAEFPKEIQPAIYMWDLKFPAEMASSQGYGFSSGMDVRVGLWRKLSAKELMLLNYGVGEDS